MELAVKDALSRPSGFPPPLFDLVCISDLLNVRGEWEVVVLGPNEKVRISGGWDRDHWGGVRVI
jgi:hypothetical protein